MNDIKPIKPWKPAIKGTTERYIEAKRREKLKKRIARIIAIDRGVPAMERGVKYVLSEDIAEKIMKEIENEV
jgi:hypothetical protein